MDESQRRMPRRIRLELIDQNQMTRNFNEMFSGPLFNLMHSYANDEGLDIEDLRFTFDDIPFAPENSPAELGMTDDCIIFVTPKPRENKRRLIELTMIDEKNLDSYLTVQYEGPLSSLMDNYSGEKGKVPEDFVFTFNDKQLKSEDTPKSLGLIDYDELQVRPKGYIDPEDLTGAEQDMLLPDNNKLIHIRTVNKSVAQEEMIFGLWYNCTMTNLARDYSLEAKISLDNFWFVFNGHQFTPNVATPKSLGMKDNDKIEVYHKQPEALQIELENIDSGMDVYTEVIRIKFVGQNEEEITFQIRSNQKMIKLMDRFSKEFKTSRRHLYFKFGCRNVQDEDTPKSLYLSDGDIIRAFTQASSRIH